MTRAACRIERGRPTPPGRRPTPTRSGRPRACAGRGERTRYFQKRAPSSPAGSCRPFREEGEVQVRIPQRARLAGVGDARGSEGGAPGLLRLGVAAASARAMRDAELAELIFRVGDEARNIYGAPKTLIRLRAPGVRARFPLERLHALRSLCRRRNQAHMGGIRVMVHKAQ